MVAKPSRSPADFEKRYRSAVMNYTQAIFPKLTRKTKQARHSPTDVELESHIRAYRIDPLLEALNWRLGDELIIESLVMGRENTSLRLDYAGIDGFSDRTVLAIEAKRPSHQLPANNSSELRNLPKDISQTLQWLAASRTGEAPPLPKPFLEHINQLRDYVIQIEITEGAWPVRAVMTNGTWLIVFEDPEDSFGKLSDQKAGKIHIFREQDFIPRRSDIFNLLEKGRCTKYQVLYDEGQIAQLKGNTDIVGCMHAVAVRENPRKALQRETPRIDVCPVLVLELTGFRWIFIQGLKERSLPESDLGIATHVQKVGKSALKLRERVFELLGREYDVISLEDHCNDIDRFQSLPAVIRRDEGSTVLITGQHTYFVVPNGHFADCRLHKATRDLPDEVFVPRADIPQEPSLELVTHLNEGTEFCCLSGKLKIEKETQIQEPDIRLAGDQTRKAELCRIYGFERYLCCQVCAFKEVCLAKMSSAPPCENYLP